jgi:hypothetical protein
MQRGIRITSGSLKSAAKIAEERAEESGAVPRDQFRQSVGVRMSHQGGQKFEFAPGGPAGPGEAKPVVREAAPAAVVSKPAEESPLPQPSGLARVWEKFLGLFDRK